MLVSACSLPRLPLPLFAAGLSLLLCACNRDGASPAHKGATEDAGPAPVRMASAAAASDPQELAIAARDAEFAKTVKPFVNSYCVDCHDADIFKGKLGLAALAAGASPGQHREPSEKVFTKLRHGEMP